MGVPKKRQPQKDRWRQEGYDEPHDAAFSEAPAWLSEYGLIEQEQPRWQIHGDTARRQYNASVLPWVNPPPPPVYLKGFGYYLPPDAHITAVRPSMQRNSDLMLDPEEEGEDFYREDSDY